MVQELDDIVQNPTELMELSHLVSLYFNLLDLQPNQELISKEFRQKLKTELENEYTDDNSDWECF